MSVIRKIKQYFKRREFKKRCLNVPCPECPYYIETSEEWVCILAAKLGLEEV